MIASGPSGDSHLEKKVIVHQEQQVAALTRGKLIVYSILPLLFIALILEGGARIREFFHPPLTADYGLGFNAESRVFARNWFGKMETRKSKLISFVDETFPAIKPYNEYRIFVLGESNVNFLHPQFPQFERELTDAINNRWQVNLVNAGGCAYGSQRLLQVAYELMDYNPDMLMIYMGHNEFEEMEQLTLVNMNTLPLQRIVYASAFMRYFRDKAAWMQIDALQRASNEKISSSPQVDYMKSAGHSFTQAEIDDRMLRFKDHLERIIKLYKNHNVPVIIGTVASNYWKPDLPPDKHTEAEQIKTFYEQGQYQKGLAAARRALQSSSRHQASETENEIIKTLAKEYELPLADVEQAIIQAEPHGVPGETLMFDRCHLNEDGKQILFQTFLPLIKKTIDSMPLETKP